MSQPITVEKYAVGQSVRRVEDVRLLQGLGRYSDDVRLPRQAAAAIVRSTHAHARVVRVDTAAAEAAPGVLAVWTEADLAADGLGNLPTDANRKRPGGAAAFATPRPALARGRVRHVGDPVVLVVAETREQATDAAALVQIEYAPLPAVAATADARRPGAPAVWDEAPDNIAFVWQAGSREAVDRAFGAAAHVTRLDFTITRVAVAPLEPRAAVGEYDRRTARYTLHTGIQGPHGSRAILADILHVPQSHVRVVTGEVGGSFGMRSGMYPEMALVLWAAKRLGRPVGWTSDRREAFVTDEHGRDNVSTAELAWTPPAGSSACAWPSGSMSARISRREARVRAPTMSAGSPGCTRRRPSAWRPPASSRTRRRRSVSRRRKARGDVCHRARDRPGRARARSRLDRAPPQERHPTVGDALQDRARLHVRLRGVRPGHGHGARPRRSRGVREAARGGARARRASGARDRQPHRGGGRAVYCDEPRHRRAPGQPRRFRGPVRRIDLDGPGQRDGVHAARERGPRGVARPDPRIRR